jgi:thiol-disulfide isomerase/thioredoxin
MQRCFRKPQVIGICGIAFTTLCVCWALLFPCRGYADVTNSTEVTQTPEAAFNNILALRAQLDKMLPADPQNLSTQQLEAVKSKIIQQAGKLSDTAEKFWEQFPTNDHVLQAMQHMMYAAVLGGLLSKNIDTGLEGMAEEIPSSLFETDVREHIHITPAQASQLQFSAEQTFAAAAIEASRLGPGNYNGVPDFMARARTDAGKRLAQALLNNPNTDAAVKLWAGIAIHHKFSVGQALPLKYTALDGREVDISHMRGKVVLVDFWATDCVFCMRGLPELISFYRQYHTNGFEIVGISTDSKKEPVLRVIQEKNVPWAIYADQDGWTNRFAAACGVTGVPDYWLVDRKGFVREMAAHGSDDDLQRKIQFLMAESP